MTAAAEQSSCLSGLAFCTFQGFINSAGSSSAALHYNSEMGAEVFCTISPPLSFSYPGIFILLQQGRLLVARGARCVACQLATAVLETWGKHKSGVLPQFGSY